MDFVQCNGNPDPCQRRGRPCPGSWARLSLLAGNQAFQVIGELERGVYRGPMWRVMEVLRAMGLCLRIETVRFPTLDELSDE